MIEKLIDYTQWANQKIISLIQRVEQEKFERDLGDLFVNDTNCPHPSLRSLAEHCMMGIEFCLSLMREKAFMAEKLIQEYRSFTKEQLLDKWTSNDQEFNILAKEKMNTSVIFRNEKFAITEDFLFAFLNHFTYHRGQINIALKMLKEKTYDADYSEFVKEELE